VPLLLKEERTGEGRGGVKREGRRGTNWGRVGEGKGDEAPQIKISGYTTVSVSAVFCIVDT